MWFVCVDFVCVLELVICHPIVHNAVSTQIPKVHLQKHVQLYKVVAS